MAAAVPPPAFDAAAVTHFWEDADSMSLSNRTRVQLAVEGITDPGDLEEYDEAGLEKIFHNLAKPAKVAGPQGRLREVEPFKVTGKAKQRLLGAALLVKFYKTISRPLTPDSIRWPVIKNFLEHWDALKERKSRSSDDSSIPKITKTVPVHTWLQSTHNYLNRRVGARCAGLSYVVRENEAVSATVPARALNEPHSEEYGSIEGDLTMRLSHSHALFKVDNAEVFDIIEQGVRGTDIAPTIAQYRKRRDGRGALKAITAQHAGIRLWEDMVKSAKEVLGGNRKWTGTTNFTINQFANLHRKAYVALTEAGEHVPVQVPDERTRVTNFMDSFQTTNPDVLAALSSVRQDEHVKRKDFELAASFLIQSCPVEDKKKQKSVTFDANVSGVEKGTPGGLKKSGGGSAVGTTGVELRYYKKDEFVKLSKPQRAEVAAWVKLHPRNGTTGKHKRTDGKEPGTPPKRWKSELSALTARSDEMFSALLDAQKVTLEAMQAQASSTSGKPAQAPAMSMNGLSEEAIRTNERARVSLLRLQSIQKSSPSGKPKESAAP